MWLPWQMEIVPLAVAKCWAMCGSGPLIHLIPTLDLKLMPTRSTRMLFGSTKVLRGGAWTTRSRMMHGTYRNFFEPHRWNIFSGFRVCKL